MNARWRMLPSVAVLVAAQLAVGAAAHAEVAGFVPQAGSVRWDGRVVTVDFTEVGLAPGASHTIAVDAHASVESTCQLGKTVLVALRSSGSATDSANYTSSEQGTINGSRELKLVVDSPGVHGLPCVTEVVRLVTVDLRDLDSGASLRIPATTKSDVRSRRGGQTHGR